MDLFERLRDVNRAAKRHDGIAFGVGRCKTRDEIRDTRAGGRDHDPGFPGHAADAAGDKGGILLVPADHGLYPGVREGIEDGIDLGSRYAKDVADALRLEGSDDQLRADLPGFIANMDFRLGPLGFVKLPGAVLTEVRLQKLRGRRQRQMKVIQRLDTEGHTRRLYIQHMAPMPPITGNEMEVITRDTECR